MNYDKKEKEKKTSISFSLFYIKIWLQEFEELSNMLISLSYLKNKFQLNTKLESFTDTVLYE